MISSKTLFCIAFDLQSRIPQAPGTSKINEKPMKNQGFHNIKQTATRCFQDAFRSAQGPLKPVKDAFKRPPDASKIPPRASKTSLRSLQDVSKSSPGACQGAPKGALRDIIEPKRLQEPPKRHPGGSKSSPRAPQELSRSTPGVLLPGSAGLANADRIYS